ncbi:MAG: Dedicator of cytokinesis protein 2 [Marteilia pararefringens]
MDWEEKNEIYIAIWSFQPKSSQYEKDIEKKLLRFYVGTLLIGLKESDEWIYGFKPCDDNSSVFYGYFPKSYVKPKVQPSDEKRPAPKADNDDLLYGEPRYSFEGKLIVSQGFKYLIENTNLEARNDYDHSEDTIVEVIKIRENLIGKKYAENDFQNQLDIYFSKLSVLYKLIPISVSCREDTRKFLSESNIDLFTYSDLYSKLIPYPPTLTLKYKKTPQKNDINSSRKTRGSVVSTITEKAKNMPNRLRSGDHSIRPTQKKRMSSRSTDDPGMYSRQNGIESPTTNKTTHLYLEIKDVRFSLPNSKIFLGIIDRSTMNYTHEVFCFRDMQALNLSKRHVLFDSINRIANIDKCFIIAYVVAGRPISLKQKDSPDPKSKEKSKYEYIYGVGALPLGHFVAMLKNKEKDMLNYQIPLRKLENSSIDDFLHKIENEIHIESFEGKGGNPSSGAGVQKSLNFSSQGAYEGNITGFTFIGPYSEGLIIDCHLYYQQNSDSEIDYKIIQNIGTNNYRNKTASIERNYRSDLVSQLLDYPLIMTVSYVRNDLYITLMDVTFGRRKINDYNVMLRAHVIEPRNRAPIPAIYCGSNEEPSCEFETTVLYKERKPRYFQCFKIKYEPNTVINCHLRIDIYHISASSNSESFIGFCYLPFNRASQRTVIESGEKKLLIYRTKDTSFVRDMRYHGLPSTQEELSYNSDSFQHFQNLKVKEDEWVNLGFYWYNTCFTSSNHLVSFLSSNPGLNPNPKTAKLSSVVQPLEEYLRSSIEENEIKKFLLPVVETLINLLGAVRQFKQDGHPQQKIHQRVSSLSFECLIKTYNMILSEKKVNLDDLDVDQDLDGITRLDDALRAPENIFSYNCYMEIVDNIPGHLNNCENKEAEKREFFNSLPFLARIAKVSRFKYCEANNHDEITDQELKDGILKFLRIRYTSKHLFSKHSSEDFHNYAVSCILLLEILADEDMDITKHVEEIKSILKNSSDYTENNFSKRLVDIILVSIIFESPESKLILTKEIINLVVTNSDCIDFKLVGSLVSIISQDYEEGSYDDLMDFFKVHLLPQTIDYILKANKENLTENIIENITNAGNVLLIYFSILTMDSFNFLVSSLKKKNEKKKLIYEILKCIEILFAVESSSAFSFQKMDMIVEQIRQANNLLIMIHRIISIIFMQPLEIGIICHFCETALEILKCRFLRCTNINKYIYLSVRTKLPQAVQSTVTCLNSLFVHIRKLYSKKHEMISLIPFLIRIAFIVGAENMEGIITHILAIIHENINDEPSIQYFKSVTFENINLSIVDFGLSSEDACNFHEMLSRINISSGLNLDLSEMIDEVRSLTTVLTENQSIDRHNSLALVLSNLLLFDNFSKSNQYDKMLTSLKQIYNILSKNESQNLIEIAFVIKEYFNTLEMLGFQNFEPGMRCKFVGNESIPSRAFLSICNAALKFMKKCELYTEAIKICKLTLPYLEADDTFTSLSTIHGEISYFYKNLSDPKNKQTISSNYSFFYIYFCGKSFKFLSSRNCIFRAEKGASAENLSNLFRVMFTGCKFEFNIMKLEALKKNHSSDENTIFIHRVDLCTKSDKHSEITPNIRKKYKIPLNDTELYLFSLHLKWNTSSKKNVSNLWQKYQIFLTTFPMPGISRLMLANLVKRIVVGPVETGIDAILLGTKEIRRGIDESERTGSCDLLESRLQGTMAAGVNGGIDNFKVFFTDEFKSDPQNESQLKYLKKFQSTLVNQFKELSLGLNILFKKSIDNSAQPILHKAYMNYKKNLNEDFKISLEELDAASLKQKK